MTDVEKVTYDRITSWRKKVSETRNEYNGAAPVEPESRDVRKMDELAMKITKNSSDNVAGLKKILFWNDVCYF